MGFYGKLFCQIKCFIWEISRIYYYTWWYHDISLYELWAAYKWEKCESCTGIYFLESGQNFRHFSAMRTFVSETSEVTFYRFSWKSYSEKMCPQEITQVFANTFWDISQNTFVRENFQATASKTTAHRNFLFHVFSYCTRTQPWKASLFT